MFLLQNRYAPTTNSIGFLEAEYARVVKAVWNWKRGGQEFRTRRVLGTLADKLDALLPLRMPPNKRLWVRTNGNWTAYFDNSLCGSDTGSPIGHLPLVLKCRGVGIRCQSSDTPPGACTVFMLYGPVLSEWLNIIRHIWAVQDGKRWEWNISGTPLTFENLKAYTQKKVKDRFTPTMLIEYCQALGIRPFDESFYDELGMIEEELD